MTAAAHPDLPPAAVLGGDPDDRRVLADDAVADFVAEQLAGVDLDGRRVCVLVPDATRSCPLPLLVGAVHRALRGRVSALTVLVALGTHAPMSDAALAVHLTGGPDPFGADDPAVTVVNHEWWDESTFATVGTIGADRVAELSGGRGSASRWWCGSTGRWWSTT